MIIKENTGEKVSSAADVLQVLSAMLATESEIDREKEHFWVLGLNTKNAIKFVDLVSLGTLTASLIHPRETFRLAVHRGVASIIVAHNHPSGDTAPSREDIAITERLRDAGEILGIKLLDHVIIGNEGAHTSMLEKGYL
ncbi:MAG: hypothetical protein M0Z67_04290 [Nitrospiraceae bacterium]|nr:hypothetical protein [Nitrospiraceae bacterium]